MPVPNSMADLAQLPSANFPTGTESIGNNLDNYIRSISAILRSTNAVASATIAAASTTDIGSADAEAVIVTGSGTINSFGTGFVGCRREVTFNGSVTITNSSNIVLPAGTTFTTAAGDIHTYRCTSPGVWKLVGQSYPQLTGVNGLVSALNGKLSTSGGVLTGDFFIQKNVPVASYVSPSNNNGFRTIANLTDSVLDRFIFQYAVGGVWSDMFTMGPSGATCQGSFTASGNLISNSDESLKRGWRRVPGLIEALAAVKCGEYERIDLGTRQVGVGAQSLRKALPLAVEEGENGILSVAYGNAALVGVIELCRRLIDLEKRVG